VLVIDAEIVLWTACCQLHVRGVPGDRRHRCKGMSQLDLPVLTRVSFIVVDKVV
jgi:hypothetical protein